MCFADLLFCFFLGGALCGQMTLSNYIKIIRILLSFQTQLRVSIMELAVTEVDETQTGVL